MDGKIYNLTIKTSFRRVCFDELTKVSGFGDAHGQAGGGLASNRTATKFIF